VDTHPGPRVTRIGKNMTEPRQDGPVRPGTSPPPHPPASAADTLLDIAANLSQYHREHEKYYAEAPLSDAISL